MTERRHDAPGGGTPSAGRDEAAPASARRKPRSQRSATVAYGGSAVAFAAVLGALSFQVAAGGDPAIGAGEPAAGPPAERVLVRRIVRRVVTTREAPAAPAPAPAPPTTRSS